MRCICTEIVRIAGRNHEAFRDEKFSFPPKGAGRKSDFTGSADRLLMGDNLIPDAERARDCNPFVPVEWYKLQLRV